MVGWMNRKKYMKKLMDGWMDKKQMDGWMDNKQMDGWMDGQKNRWLNGQKKLMAEWIEKIDG